MANAYFKAPEPVNEPIFSYGPGSPEKLAVKAKLSAMKTGPVEIPLIIGGREVHTGNMGDCRSPHDHGHLLARGAEPARPAARFCRSDRGH